jgi:transaldolase
MGPALCASPILLDEGIRTLGTSIFSVVQAIAATQVGILSISPYYNCEYIKLSSAGLIYI